MAALLTLAGAGASAQEAGTGTLVGHLIFCRTLAAPVADSDDGTSPLADVTPGGVHRKRATPIRIPAADVQLTVQGTSVSARTDATGGFALSGVPAAESLTLIARLDPALVLAVSDPDLRVGPGQTRDVGSLGLAGCAGSRAVVIGTPSESAAVADSQTSESAETTSDATAQPADESVPATDSN